MNSYANLCGWIAAALFLIGFVRYAWTIWKFRKKPFGTPGKPEPKKVSWLLWVSLDAITFSGMWAEHALNGQIISTQLAWGLVALGFLYGKPGWTKLEKFCLGGSSAALLFWAASGNPIVGIVVSNAVIFCASFPSIEGAWRNPRGEDRVAWLAFFLSCPFQLLGVWLAGNYSAGAVVQPINFTIIETAMVCLLFVPGRFGISWYKTPPQ